MEEYILAKLNVYTYNKNKIKCDYSIFPVSTKDDGKTWKSEVSDEVYNGKKFHLKEISSNEWDLVKFNKINDECGISIISVGTLEDEDVILKKIYSAFKVHFWYKFKYKKFLDKKKRLRQINF